MLSVNSKKNRGRPNSVDAHVGRRIRERRQWQNMTQATLGDAIGVTFQQVQKYEKGMNRVGASRLQQISKALKVQPSYFFEGTIDEIWSDGQSAANHADIPPEVIEFAASEEGMELIRAFSRVDDNNVRCRLVKLIKSLGTSGGA
ncbi:helix-turn-helix domain-containing protein [Sinorhizobium psoraleae]|uniref:Helix-turn-helix domain-containing protein n=1 Tax=Sinorhizobium psoraleae TaxID=520838 RepID=A0ABT4KMJ4_9HYPH|nr:helix-turn-helix domain-containing protein [Sinorhizobium psoraleae]MCZ4093172.1 helix-turn-helix domain-containing protein [Sinorhizobium psoraleae]